MTGEALYAGFAFITSVVGVAWYVHRLQRGRPDPREDHERLRVLGAVREWVLGIDEDSQGRRVVVIEIEVSASDPEEPRSWMYLHVKPSQARLFAQRLRTAAGTK